MKNQSVAVQEQGAEDEPEDEADQSRVPVLVSGVQCVHVRESQKVAKDVQRDARHDGSRFQVKHARIEAEQERVHHLKETRCQTDLRQSLK